MATQGENGQTTVHTVQGMDGQTENMTVDLSEAGLGQENQLIITGEDGHGYPVSVSGMITVPMSSMYQMVANIQHLHQNGDGTVCLTPIQVSNTGGGGSMAPNAKYTILRAATAPGNTIRVVDNKGGYGNGEGGNNGLVADGEDSKVGTQGQMSTGLASLMDVIQLQMKNDNDCNNNDHEEEEVVEEEDEEDEEEEVDDEDDVEEDYVEEDLMEEDEYEQVDIKQEVATVNSSGGSGTLQREKLEIINIGGGQKRIVVHVKQK